MEGDKYVVFKASDWEEFLKLLNDGTPQDVTVLAMACHKVEDAVVLRRQDKFTAAALWSYAHAVLNTDDILNEYKDDYPDSDLMYHLHTLHNWAADQAGKAERERGKVPD